MLLSLFCFFGCRQNQQQNIDGGPCSYSITTQPATIIAIYPLTADSSEYELVFEVKHSEEQVDTLYFRTEFSRYLTKSEFISGQYGLGKSMTYEHRSITSGACNPDIFMLKMEEYKQ